MPERIAIIDIGTNTFNLLLVDKDKNNYTTIYSKRVGVGLGHGGINKSTIVKPAINRGIKCLQNFSIICKQYQTKSIFAYGTSALRHASNANQFILSVKKECNIHIKVLNGQEEAYLIYKGVKKGFNFNSKCLIMDIGGGSTEFILADKDGIIDKHSLEIGVSRINQMFNFSDRLTTVDINKIESYLDTNIQNKLNNLTAKTLIGSSGSFETFYELAYKTEYPKGKYKSIEIDLFKDTLYKIIQSSLSERSKNHFIIPIRREMIPIAAVKTLYVINKMKCSNIIVSPNSLKEGAVYFN